MAAPAARIRSLGAQARHGARLARDPLGLFVDAAAQHGDAPAFPLQVGPPRMLVLRDAELVGELLTVHDRSTRKGRLFRRARAVLGDGLLLAEGEAHRRQRRVLQPRFARRELDGYADAMGQVAAAATAGWPPGDHLDLGVELQRVALDVVAATLFGGGLSPADRATIPAALDSALALFGVLALPGGERLLGVPAIPRVRRFHAARAAMDRVVLGIIAERRAAADPGDDLVGQLVAYRDEDGAPLPDGLVRDEAMTIFIAGQETTANALAWAFLLLAQDPTTARAVHEEALAALGDGPADAASVAQLPLAARVVQETLRLYPPIWGFGREATAPFALGGVEVAAGENVISLPWLLHRDPRWWPEPERFHPERWLAADPARPRHAYLPFGAGPHMCIGAAFAMAEAAIVLATVARRFRVDVDPAAYGRPKAGVTLRPPRGVPCTLRAW